MIRAALPRVTPGLGDVLESAIASLSHCADLVAAAGCSPAATYIAGAQGNVRRALAELANRWPHLRACDADDFDVARYGCSEIVSMAGYPDTIRQCITGDGGRVDVRALVQERQVERGVWMQRTCELENVQIRGRVELDTEGCRFIEVPDLECTAAPVAGCDLGRDILASGLDLSQRATFAVALEATLVAGSWVHLGTGRRWYSDCATARAVVRVAGGVPGADVRLVRRLGGCVDREVLRHIETLGWRHWPTPSAWDETSA